ncbi:MAG: hypothetical protein AUG90_00340 [Verrucomicrobia bacterium 13_1_20CM_4_55_9]|nr:MAG: hypothetical protein AUG90_00340 [Verrucomicrobia bacterium 13_1_20CM_4_55_9]
MKQIRRLLKIFALFSFLFFGSCESYVPTGSAGAARFAQAPTDRPGLGTKWGETRRSRVGYASFRRADSTHPVATAAIYYNDAAGIRAMAGAVTWQRHWPLLPAATENLISVGLKDQSGRFLPGLIVDDRWFVVGEEGRRYSIVVRNKTDLRLEIVLSVDGLDVLDGGKASVRKPGHVMAPKSQLKVEGFRQSTEAVAAFRFGPVRESYAAEKYRNTQNVGVVGVAVFNEFGTNPWTGEEVRKRLNANPFPGRFATPP